MFSSALSTWGSPSIRLDFRLSARRTISPTLLAREQVIGDSSLWSVIGSRYYVREDWVAGTMAEGQWHAQSSRGGVASSLIFGNAFDFEIYTNCPV